MSFRSNDPTEWANKRKAQIERARVAREERKNGGAPTEDHSFQPQVNKRPQYLGTKHQDSLDAQLNQYRDPNDPMEQPLPGAGGKAKVQQTNYDDHLPGHSSPKQDTLGNELKKYSSGEDNAKYESVNRRLENEKYKSAFLNQYENDKKRQNMQRPAPAAEDRAGAYGSEQKQKPKVESADEVFASMLRNDGKSAGPGWNDDTGASSGLFGPPPPIRKKNTPPPANRSRAAREQAHQREEEPPLQQPRALPTRRRQPQQAAVNQQGWNEDTEVPSSFAEFDKIAPVNPAADATLVRQARSKLGLLKSKIRQSESGGSNRSGTMQSSGMQSNSMASFGADGGLGGDSASGAGTGRRTAPSPQPDEDFYEPAYQPRASRPVPVRSQEQEYGVSGVAATSRRRQPVPQPQPQQHQRDTNEYNPEPAHPPARARRSQQQLSQPQPQQYEEQAYPPKTPPPAVSKRQPAPAPAPAPSGYSMPSEYPDEYAAQSQPTHECPDCGRKFNAKAYERHVKICAKVFIEKRKTFDSTKMRVADNPELVKILTKAQKEEQQAAKRAAAAVAKGDQRPARAAGGATGASGKGGPSWKEQSSQLREAMKAARQVAKAISEGGPMPDYVPSAPDPSLMPCPHCGRRFNQKAGERHIPQCQNIKAKPKQLQRGKGGGGGINGGTTKNKRAGGW